MTTNGSVVTCKVSHIFYNGRPCEDNICPVGTESGQIRKYLVDLHCLGRNYVRDDAGECVYAHERIRLDRKNCFHFFCDLGGNTRRHPPLKTSWFPWVQVDPPLIVPLKRPAAKKVPVGNDQEERVVLSPAPSSSTQAPSRTPSSPTSDPSNSDTLELSSVTPALASLASDRSSSADDHESCEEFLSCRDSSGDCGLRQRSHRHQNVVH